MTQKERQAQWETKRLLAAVECALVKAEAGKWQELFAALTRVEGITTAAKTATFAAQFERITHAGN